MSLQRTMQAALGHIQRFADLERVLAGVCTLIPVPLIVLDGGTIRDSVSAYYAMAQNQVYCFLLTMAAMLFVFNGVVKKRRAYNTILGLCLAGVVLFNLHDFPTLHYVFAAAFFGGNGVVILVYTSKKEPWFRGLIAGFIAIAIAGYFLFHWLTLFWIEWISLAIIALHYIVEARLHLESLSAERSAAH